MNWIKRIVAAYKTAVKMYKNRRAYKKISGAYIYLFNCMTGRCYFSKDFVPFNPEALNLLIDALEKIDCEYALIGKSN